MKCKECGAPIKKNETVCKECSSNGKREKSIIYNNKEVKELKLGLNVKDPLTISKDNKEKQRQSLLFKALIAVAVLIVISGGFLVYLIIDTGKDNSDKSDKNVVESPKGYKRIGSKDHGYINIPENWIENKNQNNELIYYNEDEKLYGSIIISVAAKTEETSSAEQQAEILYEELVEAEAKDINKKEITVDSYKMHQVYGSMEQSIAYAWTFEDKSGKINTITLLYPIAGDDLSQIIHSYKSEN